MEWIKTYLRMLLIAVVAITTPLVINWMILQPQKFEVVGDGTDWLGFWGGYLGSIFTAWIALFVLWRQLKQNHKENEDNRNLQLRILKHSNAQRGLDEIKTRLIDFQVSYNLLIITPIVENIINEKYDKDDINALTKLVRDIDEKALCIKVALNGIKHTNELNKFNKIFTEIYNEYGLLIGDLLFFIDLMRNMPTDAAQIEPYVQYHIDNTNALEEEGVKKLMSQGIDISPSIAFIIEKIGDYLNIKENIRKIMDIRHSEPSAKIATLKEELKDVILNLVNIEQKRIDNILTGE